MDTVRHEFQQRQHMLLEDYEVYHYYDSQELHVSLHFHDFYECYLLVSGQASYQVDSAVFDMRPGDLLLISPNQLHRPIIGDASVPYERIVLWLSQPYIRRLSTRDSDLASCFHTARHGVFRFPKAIRSAIEGKLLQIVESAERAEFGQDVLCKSYIENLLVYLNRYCMDESHVPGRADSAENRLVSSVTAYLDAHLDQPVGLDALAGEVYLSKYYLTRAFKKATGATIYQMLLQKRMIRARDMILEGTALSAVAEQCGFSDYSGFYKAFRSEYGLAPGEYLRCFSARKTRVNG